MEIKSLYDETLITRGINESQKGLKFEEKDQLEEALICFNEAAKCFKNYV